MSSFLYARVLITGGAGGLGQRLTRKVLQEGAQRVVLWDVNQEGLEKTVQELQDFSSRLVPQVVDLSEPDQIYNRAEQVLNENGAVDILINNAGVVVGRPFVEITPRQIQRVINLNVSGVMHTTRAFLPSMIARGGGHVVTISSAAALMGNPRMAVYAGSKWAVTGWAESLRLEMEQTDTNIKVTTVQPSYINTGMFKGVTVPLCTPLLELEVIARKIVEAIKHDRPILREPFMVKLLPFLKGVLPAAVFDFIAGRLFGVYRSMKTFEGDLIHDNNE